MKKLVSVLLAAIMLFSLTLPVFGAVNMFETKSQIPVILIAGDGNTIYDKNDQPLSKFSNFFNNQGEKNESSAVAEVIKSAGVMYKEYLFEGLLKDNWDPFYEAIQTEVSKYFGDILLDENGEATNGTHISQWCLDQNAEHMRTDYKTDKGYYGVRDYQFWYDWRLDPMVIADDFNEYVKAVKEATNSEKVSIICRCLGTNVVCAYLTKYGTDDIYGIGFDGVVCLGAEPLSESMSGKFKVDMSSIKRVLADGESVGMLDLDPIVLACIELVDRSGLVDGYVALKKATLYEKLVKGVTSALTLSSVAYPCYWACVKTEDFDTAIEYVFGDEGSESASNMPDLSKKSQTITNRSKRTFPRFSNRFRKRALRSA